GQRPVPLGDGLRDQAGHCRIGWRLAEVDEVQPDLQRERAHKVDLPDHPVVDEDPPDRLGDALLLLQRELELIGRDQPFLDEDLTELLLLLQRRAPRSGLSAFIRSLRHWGGRPRAPRGPQPWGGARRRGGRAPAGGPLSAAPATPPPPAAPARGGRGGPRAGWSPSRRRMPRRTPTGRRPTPRPGTSRSCDP